MTILVDINIFEDIFRQRAGWEASLGIVGLVANGGVGGYVPVLTAAILYFFRRRSRGERAARQAVRGMLRRFRIVPLDGAAVEAAYGSALPDFEDALQFGAARATNVDAIITRNRKDFRQRHVPVFSPNASEIRVSGVPPFRPG